MFNCSLCKFKTEYPSEWKRHINLTKHQKLIKSNKNIFKEEYEKNKKLMCDMENDKQQNKKLKIQEKINKIEIKMNKLEEELKALKEDLSSMT